jgi:predicted nucleic acid-binding protein
VVDKPAIVLDTNVVLDWMVFRNPQCTPLIEAIESGRVRWLVTEAMRGELAHVIERGVVDAWSPDVDSIFESWRKLSETVSSPQSMDAAQCLRCTDADDQKFVDLAICQARWLVSRDRAVLKLARRAHRLGVRVVAPERWSAE